MGKKKDTEIKVVVTYTGTPEELSRRFTLACLEVLKSSGDLERILKGEYELKDNESHKYEIRI